MSKKLQKIDFISPGSDTQAYIKSVSNIGVLSKEEEIKLAENLYYNQDLDSARKLIMSHLRFVVHIAKSYSGYDLPLADLIQEGNVGLMKAVKRFNPSIGVRLVSFAVHWIKAEIHEFILKNWKIVKIATTKAQRKLFFNLRSAKKKLSWLSQEETVKIAEDLGVKPKQVSEMELRLTSQDKSFDAPCDDEKESFQFPVNYLEDYKNTPHRLLEISDWENNSTIGLRKAIEILDSRSKDIINRRWLTETKETLCKLAKEYGVSAERVRQLERNAIKKMREFLAGNSYEQMLKY